MIKQHLVAYIATAVTFLALDAVWLTLMADRLYRPALGQIMLARFEMAPAALFYLLYVLGIVVFAVSPAFASGRWSTALGLGALLGLIAYATYDLTNQATLKDWPWRVTLADLGWGTFVTAIAATAGWRVGVWVGNGVPHTG